MQWVATTVDAWSCRNRSFLGMTCHWINPVTLKREQATLACRRLRGSLTKDKLTATMEDVHRQFGIAGKIARTTMDNGSNFVGAFSNFGSKKKSLQEPAQDMGDEAEQYFPLADLLGKEQKDYTLPKHMRCAAHCLHLVATTDAAAAEKDDTFKAAQHAATAKAGKLWAAAAQKADSIEDEVGNRLIVVPSGRGSWKSTYDAVVALLKVLEDKELRQAIPGLCSKLGVENFEPEDILFLQEYAWVMKHAVAEPLAQLQQEENAYLGYLLPTIAVSWYNMEEELKKKRLTYCEPMLAAVLAGSKKRFQQVFIEVDCWLAAAFHPCFRLHWLHLVDNSADRYTWIRRFMELALAEHLKRNSEEESGLDSGRGSGTKEEEEECEVDYFFQTTTTFKVGSAAATRAHNSATMVQDWLAGANTKKLDLKAFMSERALMALFLEYNTPVPCSAAVAEVFSQGKDILRDKRSPLTDVNFEELVVLRGNEKLWPELTDD